MVLPAHGGGAGVANSPHPTAVEAPVLRHRYPKLACAALAATVACVAHAGGPTRVVVATRGAGNVLLGAPAIGVHPTAPAAIAPSFRSPTLTTTRFIGPRLVPGFPLPVYVGAPSYFDPVAIVAAPPVAAAPVPPPAPPAPPAPEVVEHADGRYVLRGNGVEVPYRWAWIPNPPAAPPPTTAPASKPDVRLYGGTDEDGVVHVTDRFDRIPARHREQAKRNASS
jgi:hypothetical protein